MISREILKKDARENLDEKEWLFNVEIKQAKWFNEIGHQFFDEGKYKNYRKATQMEVSQRLLYVMERLEEDYIKMNQQYIDNIAELNAEIEMLKSGI